MNTPHPPPAGEGGDFQIGGDLWPGLAKVAEECGELLQQIGKIIAYPHSVDHPDGTTDQRGRLMEEMADVTAAIRFLLEQAEFGMHERTDFISRVSYKMERFRYWHQSIQERKS